MTALGIFGLFLDIHMCFRLFSIDSASWLQIPRCCLTLHRVLGKAASPMSCAALAHAGHFPVLVEPWPRSDRGQGRSKSH